MAYSAGSPAQLAGLDGLLARAVCVHLQSASTAPGGPLPGFGSDDRRPSRPLRSRPKAWAGRNRQSLFDCARARRRIANWSCGRYDGHCQLAMRTWRKTQGGNRTGSIFTFGRWRPGATGTRCFTGFLAASIRGRRQSNGRPGGIRAARRWCCNASLATNARTSPRWTRDMGEARRDIDWPGSVADSGRTGPQLMPFRSFSSLQKLKNSCGVWGLPVRSVHSMKPVRVFSRSARHLASS